MFVRASIRAGGDDWGVGTEIGDRTFWGRIEQAPKGLVDLIIPPQNKSHLTAPTSAIRVATPLFQGFLFSSAVP